MGESDRYLDYKNGRRKMLLGQDGNALVALITINIIFFLLLLVIEVIYDFSQVSKADFYNQVVQYFELPAQLSRLAQRPWTLLTYMFTQVRVMGLIGNMIWLWVFGYILQALTDNKKLIPIYIYGGVAGAVVFIIVSYTFPILKTALPTASIMGGNAATMAVAMATTALAPRYKFFTNLNGGIPIWVVTMVYLLIDLAGVVTLGAAHSMAHIAGAAAGFVFIYFLQKGNDGSIWMNGFYHWFIHMFSPNNKSSSTKIKEKVFYNTGGTSPFKKTANITQNRVDEILDKINQKGYHFLTEEEKNILKRAAEEDL
jgi:membrane associated rhomboid family serine protease